MNSKKRARLERAIPIIESAIEIVEDVMDDEQDGFDRLPPSIQESVKGMSMEEVIDTLDDAKGELEDAVECLNNAIDYITEAKNTKT